MDNRKVLGFCDVLYSETFKALWGGGLVHEYWNHNIRIFKISHLSEWVHWVGFEWPNPILANPTQTKINTFLAEEMGKIGSPRANKASPTQAKNFQPKPDPGQKKWPIPALIPSIVRYRFGFSWFWISGNFFVIPRIKNPLLFAHSMVVRLFPPAAIGSCFL